MSITPGQVLFTYYSSCVGGENFKLFPLPFSIFDLVHVQVIWLFDTDEQLLPWYQYIVFSARAPYLS